MRTRGFTLIELMIVTAIIGLLAAIAIPSFGRYIRRSKTSEALTQIRKIYDGEIAYFRQDFVNRQGARISSQFVSAGPEPATVPVGTRVLGSWSDTGWSELKFALESPIHYRYQAIATGTGLDARFTARAEGDLDGDNTTSLFERICAINSATGEAEGGAGVYSEDELE